MHTFQPPILDLSGQQPALGSSYILALYQCLAYYDFGGKNLLDEEIVFTRTIRSWPRVSGMAEGEGAKDFRIEIQKVEVQKVFMTAADIASIIGWCRKRFPSLPTNAGHLHFFL
jgi:hypothetical protein